MMIALLTLLVITMIVAAAASAMPVQLFSATHGGETQAAFMAARSGLDYAYSRLQERDTWMGNGDGSAGVHLIVNTPQMQVVEDNGNVIGVMVNGDGNRSAFRFKFNFQNGGSTSPDDGFPDPAPQHKITNRYLSYNNVPQSLTINTYEANPGTGVVINTVKGTLPKFNAEIQVEGLAGPGLATATVDNLDTLMASSSIRRRIYTQQVGSRYNVSGSSTVDCVVAAANAFTAAATEPVVGNTTVVEAPNTSAPKLRTRSTANTTAGNFTTTGEVRVDNLAGSSMASVTPIQENAALQEAHFLRVKTTQVQKATAADTRLKAGTYVWRPNGGNYQLEYYAQNFNGTIPTGPPTDVMSNPGDYGRFISNGSGISFDFTSMGANIDNKVFVDPQSAGTVTDLAIVIEPGLQSTIGIRPTASFLDTGTPAILSASGNITMQGSLDGYGGVTSDKDIKFQGASAFETDPLNSICVYARGDITVEAIPDSVVTALAPLVPGGVGMGMGKKVGHKSMGGMSTGTVTGTNVTAFPPTPGDVSLTGIIYALGDFNLDLTTSANPLNHGNFFMEGLLTAYGGNPDAGELPGANGQGQVNIRAKNSELYYDPSYLIQLQGSGNPGGGPINLTQVSWNLLP